jgi:hypothetical protein
MDELDAHIFDDGVEVVLGDLAISVYVQVHVIAEFDVITIDGVGHQQGSRYARAAYFFGERRASAR